MALSVPFVALAAALFNPLAPLLRAGAAVNPWALTLFVIALLLLVPLHELIHAIAYGCGLRSPDLLVGFWPSRVLPYVLYDAPLPRWRVLFMLSGPFLALTILPLALAALSFATAGFCFFAVLHAALCAGDAMTAVRILPQMPRQAIIHNQRWQTYWLPGASPRTARNGWPRGKS